MQLEAPSIEDEAKQSPNNETFSSRNTHQHHLLHKLDQAHPPPIGEPRAYDEEEQQGDVSP